MFRGRSAAVPEGFRRTWPDGGGTGPLRVAALRSRPGRAGAGRSDPIRPARQRQDRCWTRGYRSKSRARSRRRSPTDSNGNSRESLAAARPVSTTGRMNRTPSLGHRFGSETSFREAGIPGLLDTIREFVPIGGTQSAEPRRKTRRRNPPRNSKTAPSKTRGRGPRLRETNRRAPHRHLPGMERPAAVDRAAGAAGRRAAVRSGRGGGAASAGKPSGGGAGRRGSRTATSRRRIASCRS